VLPSRVAGEQRRARVYVFLGGEAENSSQVRSSQVRLRFSSVPSTTSDLCTCKRYAWRQSLLDTGLALCLPSDDTGSGLGLLRPPELAGCCLDLSTLRADPPEARAREGRLRDGVPFVFLTSLTTCPSGERKCF